MKVTVKKMKEEANSLIMDRLSVMLGSWEQSQDTWPEDWHQWSEEQRQDYREVLQFQADRVATLLGFTKAWYS